MTAKLTEGFFVLNETLNAETTVFEVIILPIGTDTITSIVHTLELLGRLKPVKSFKILYSNVQRVKCHLSSSSFLLHVK